MSAFPYIGRRFTPEQFEAYVAGLQINWGPKFCTLHNTGLPTLAQRPVGFTEVHLQNLLSYYRDQKKWSAGPHLFIDDKGIIVFCDLTKPGVHAPSWNDDGFGVECLGDFNVEPWESGRGALVQNYAARAVATLCKKIGVPASTIRFHKEDPETTHKDCPGSNVSKPAFVARVAALLTPAASPVATEAEWTVTVEGANIAPVLQQNGSLFVPVRALANALGASVSVAGRTVTVEKGSAE